MGKRHTTEQIIRKLRQAEVDLAGGLTIGQVCQKLGVSEQTFHRWRNRYGGVTGDDAKRLRELEAENSRLKRLVAELALDKQLLQEVVRKKF
jgi:transposase-like protein